MLTCCYNMDKLVMQKQILSAFSAFFFYKILLKQKELHNPPKVHSCWSCRVFPGGLVCLSLWFSLKVPSKAIRMKVWKSSEFDCRDVKTP